MRIADVCAFYSPQGGGVRTYIEQKLALSGALGVDMTVIVPGDDDRLEERGGSARIVTLRAPRLPVDRKYGYFDDEAAIHSALDRWAPDLVEASSPWRSPAMVATWRPDIPKSLVMHADPLAAYAYRYLGPFMTRAQIDKRCEGYWRHLRRLGAAFATIICANEQLAGRLRAGGVAGVQTLPMGVQAGLFSPQRRDLALRQELLRRCELGDDAILLIAAGRLAAEKRIPMLIEAVTSVGRHWPVGMVIIGEGREKGSLLKSIAGNPHIRVLPPERNRAHFATILASADALIHGCEAETFCMVAAEARASGIPVIVPDLGGAADFAREGGGLTFQAGSGSDVARAIREFAEMGFRGARDEKSRTMEDHFTELFGSYRAIIEAQRVRAA
ncbi:glycosyltransferase [Croceibacterium aestuarii]|uniref:glycosyltransferase n=1 Tax=Croceibacterium aestuarii TaxID=3064139 RepID=UPI00272ECFE6|nr:glycosyltransferase [Croceibacterium sp. D39]